MVRDGWMDGDFEADIISRVESQVKDRFQQSKKNIVSLFYCLKYAHYFIKLLDFDNYHL